MEFARLVVALMALAFVSDASAQTDLRVLRFDDTERVEIAAGRERASLVRGERFGDWTLMDVVVGERPFAVLEDWQEKAGRIAIVDREGVRLELPKTLEPSTADPTKLYLGRTREQIGTSAIDLLATDILSQAGDPSYERIASVFPPLQKISNGTFSFVGTPDTAEKIGFNYGGRTSYFDPAVYDASITRAREAGNVWHGLVGGHLPVMRFVYPDTNDAWTEMLAFAPFRIVNGNTRVQPVWYRVTRIEGGRLVWSRYVDSYQLFPPRTADDSRRFYAELLQLKSGWDDLLSAGMSIDLPDERVENMARFALVRAIMTRVEDFPKYGVVDKNYGANEHDGFPDTFNVETTTMIEWGLLERARRYIDNYFTAYVRDDGSILYRGPETGQYGRMLTVLAQYANAGGDRELLLRHRKRIDAIALLLLAMRAKALERPANDAAYGMISGWSEADSALDPDPPRYMQPYFSNSTEAARGFRDIGHVWEAIGLERNDADLTAWGRRLSGEAVQLRKDLKTAIDRSLLTIDGKQVLPAIAGVSTPFHLAVQQDRLDPQHRSYRAYMEMMYSGSLPEDLVRSIVDYRSSHRDVLLGIPTAYGYGTGEIAGFLLYGHVFGLMQHDMIREALLAMHSNLAHQFTRGMWLAPETRRPLLDADAAPYCTPAQLTAALFARWQLVFEDPEADVLWLGKAIPRDWLEHGKQTSFAGAVTRWGRVDLTLSSSMKRKRISARLSLPATGLRAETRLRVRAPGDARLRAVTVNGKRWTQFDAEREYIVIPAGTSGSVAIEARY